MEHFVRNIVIGKLAFLSLATLSAMAHLPAETPAEFRRHEQLFATADELGQDYEAKEHIFRRMTFNVGTGESDDHTKNFSFWLKAVGIRKLAPAYGRTASVFPNKDPWRAQARIHQLSVNGKLKDSTDADLLTVADRLGVGTANRVLAEV